ncbi:hypothetical protein [Ruminiclostridium papyrosolvens]|uniref:Uncharacterized protein n=1 Tax=Ruminiclostridium papyrosolvens C7 TaxID=1330534 RepID=U4QWS2_9FIRM|nr:hypothetical protein [Ruminiclostridium papyrosolvens]EPR07794.1 hypothetical protein L323_20055 [Ruminiclostridium papyrosolvens C7]
MAVEADVKVKQYIHKVSIDRKTGEKLSETYEPYGEVPEITLEEHTNKLLRATVGDVDSYVGKMLEDLKMQERERTPQGLEHRAEGA